MKKKDLITLKLAPEPGAVYYTKKDKDKLYYLTPNEANAHYNIQSPQDSTVKAWLIVPYI